MKKLWLAILFLIAVMACTYSIALEGKDDVHLFEYPVWIERIIDGDTIVVTIDLGFNIIYKQQRVRLLGIDAYEKKGATKEKGLEAKSFTESFFAQPGAKYILVTPGKKDSFGRILGNFRNPQGYYLKDGLAQAGLTTGRFIETDVLINSASGPPILLKDASVKLGRMILIDKDSGKIINN